MNLAVQGSVLYGCRRRVGLLSGLMAPEDKGGLWGEHCVLNLNPIHIVCVCVWVGGGAVFTERILHIAKISAGLLFWRSEDSP